MVVVWLGVCLSVSTFVMSDFLNYSPSNRFHVADCKSTQWQELGKCFNAEWFRGDDMNNRSITRFEKGRIVFKNLSGMMIHLGLEFIKMTSHMLHSVAVHHRGVSHVNLTRVAHDNCLAPSGSAPRRSVWLPWSWHLAGCQGQLIVDRNFRTFTYN